MTLEEFPRGYPIAFGHFPAAFLYPLAVPGGCPVTYKSISQQLLAETEQFFSIFPEGQRFC
jgi:hypothetical protein